MKDKVAIHTELGDFIIQERWGDVKVTSTENLNLIATIDSPDMDDLASADSATARMPDTYGGFDADEMEYMPALAQFCANLVWHIDNGNAERIEEAKQRAEEERLERERKAKERAEELDRRRDVLMHELVGERVRMRQYGYKTLRAATVDVVETYDGNYKPFFRYGPQDQARTQDINQLKRLDVRQKNGTWLTVWDDGLDDLNPWERDSPSLKPVEKMYDGQLREDD